MCNKPSILVVTPRFPYPVIGGDRLRIYYICKELQRKYKLTLLSLCDSRAEMNYQIPIDHVFADVHRVFLPKWRSIFNCLFALFTNTPLQIAYYRSRNLKIMLDQMSPDYSAVFFHLIRVGDMAADVKKLKFLEMTDAISLNYLRIKSDVKTRFSFRALIYSFEFSRLEKYEKKISSEFTHSFLVSNIDYNFLFKNSVPPENKITVASNGVDLERLPYSYNKLGKDLIFIGNMNSLQNLDAVIYMIDEILPLITSKFPDVNLRIVGRINEKDNASISNHPNVIVTGEISSIPDAVTGGAVGVAPMRLGAGIQNKVLEYMALGLPVVTTSIGLEGIRARSGIELYEASNPEDFANRVIELLVFRDVASKMAESAKVFVEENHQWSSALEPMMDAISNSISKNSFQ